MNGPTPDDDGEAGGRDPARTDSDGDGAGGEMARMTHERALGGRLGLWFLVDGNRVAVATILLAVGYLLLVALGQFGPSSTGKLLGTDPIFALFTPAVISIIMGVSLVLTFNQLVLSQELGPLGELRGKMDETMAFRRDVEAAVDEGTSPPEPSRFLRGLLVATGERGRRLAAAAAEEPDEEVREEVRAYAGTVVDHAERVAEDLEGEPFGRFGVVGAALDYNYSWKIYAGRRLLNRHEETLSAKTRDVLEELLDTLELFGPAREHFKTLYFRWEIIGVSRSLVAIAVPALAVAAYMILAFDGSRVPGSTLGVTNALLVVGLAFAASAAPFALFLAYILRIITVAKWTLAIGPFVLRETERGSELDWE